MLKVFASGEAPLSASTPVVVLTVLVESGIWGKGIPTLLKTGKQKQWICQNCLGQCVTGVLISLLSCLPVKPFRPLQGNLPALQELCQLPDTVPTAFLCQHGARCRKTSKISWLKCMQASRARVSGLSCLGSFTCLSWANQVVLNASSFLKHASKRTACKASAQA